MVHLTEYFVHRSHKITLPLSQTTDISNNFVGPLEFEITRVDLCKKIQQYTFLKQLGKGNSKTYFTCWFQCIYNTGNLLVIQTPILNFVQVLAREIWTTVNTPADAKLGSKMSKVAKLKLANDKGLKVMFCLCVREVNKCVSTYNNVILNVQKEFLCLCWSFMARSPAQEQCHY